MNRITIYIAIALLFIIVSGCSNSITSKVVSQDGKNTIKIGAIYPLTGPAALLGEEFRNGVILAVEDVNAKGGINGKPIEIIFEDSIGEPKTAVNAFNKLIEFDKVNIVLTVVSSVSLSLVPLANANEVLLFADGSHPDITGKSNFVFRHSNTVEGEGKTISDFVLKKFNPKKIGIFYGNDDYGFAFEKELRRIFELADKNIEIYSEQFDMKGNDFRTNINKILYKKPDTVIVIGFGSAFTQIIKQLKEQGFDGNIVTSLGFILSNTKSLGELVDGIYYTNLKLSGNSDEFKQRYKQRFGKTPAFAFFPYGDIELIRYAIETIESTNNEKPEAIAEFIRNLEEINGSIEHMTINNKGDVMIETEVKEFEFHPTLQ